MSGFICPHCNTETPLFGKGGGARTAERMNVHFFGSIPFDPRVVEAADVGKTLMESPADSPFIGALERLTAEIVESCATDLAKG